MRKFVSLNELTTENILSIASKCDYQICVEEFDGYTGLQDAGIEFIGVKGIIDERYVYSLGDIEFAIPTRKINQDEEYWDTYLLFDLLEKI